MSKKQDVSAPVDATEVAPATTTALSAATPSGVTDLCTDAPKQFVELYKAQITEVMSNLPSKAKFQELIMNLPEAYEPLVDLVKKSMGSHKGIMTQDDTTKFPELRLYQGTGNDKNRPPDMVPGQFYMVPMEPVGKTFEGTVIAMWTGSLMWQEGVAVPVCSSMDRVVGSTFGNCKACPSRPFAVRGQPNDCSNEVVALMLRKNLGDLVIVRFSKTSEPAGRQLMNYVKRSMEPWARWYTVSAVPTTGKDPSKRYFVSQVTPQTGDDAAVPEAIWSFCDAMYYSVMATYVLPMVRSVYQRAEQYAAEDAESTSVSAQFAEPVAETADPTNWGNETPNV